MDTGTLPHEAWDEKKVQGMVKGWKNPLTLLENLEALEKDRHWRLVNEISSLIEGFSVLDVGCGMGHLFALIDSSWRYLGIDSSEAMIETARAFYPNDREVFQVGSAYNLEEYPSADTVVASGLILHLPDPVPVLQQMWSKANICMVLSAWVGETEIIWRGKQPLYKRLLPPGWRRTKKYIIQRRDTLPGLLGKLYELPGVRDVTSRPFHNPYEGESNRLFKVRRER